MARYWIQKAIKRPGSLESFFKRKFGLPKNRRIPVSALKKIVAAKAGQTITLKVGRKKRRIKVTGLLERRAILALTLRKLRR